VTPATGRRMPPPSHQDDTEGLEERRSQLIGILGAETTDHASRTVAARGDANKDWDDPTGRQRQTAA
jgi:hypothetical protein